MEVLRRGVPREAEVGQNGFGPRRRTFKKVPLTGKSLGMAMTEQDQADAEVQNSDKDPLDSWEEGSAFGVSDDSDPVCETPVEE